MYVQGIYIPTYTVNRFVVLVFNHILYSTFVDYKLALKEFTMVRSSTANHQYLS